MSLVSVINESKNRKWGLSAKFSADSLKKIKVANFCTRTRSSTVLGYPLELDNETIAENTTYQSHRTWQNQGGAKLGASSYWLASMVLEDTKQAARVER